MLVRSYKGAGTMLGSTPGRLRIAMSVVFGIGGVLLKIGTSSLCRISTILFDLISIICGIGGRYRGSPSVQFRVQCDYFSLRSQIQPPWACETAAALGLERGAQDSKAHSPGYFDISYDPEHREAGWRNVRHSGCSPGDERNLAVSVGWASMCYFIIHLFFHVYCTAHHVLFFPSISVGAAGVPDFLDDLTGIASFGKVLLHVWTIKKADKSGHGV
ncbi:hypothetical protein K439DRAFT_1665249 [Ramaria rubella]|nr:hypothetical protein K439DRAFT_1665249 [Ramaria rubella]